MSQFQVRQKLPLGLAWNWVKFSFATFREKPVNFIAFSLAFIVFSIAPFIGSFLNILLLARIYFSADKVTNEVPFGLELNFAELFRQRNIVIYALFNMFFDLLLMSVFQEVMLGLHIENTPAAMIEDHRVALILLGLSLIRIVFFGISLAIITLNPQVKLFSAIMLSWRFMFRHWIILILSAFLLLPFLLIPLYIAGLIVVSVNNMFLFVCAMFILLIFVLLFIAVTTIYSYKLYRDGIVING